MKRILMAGIFMTCLLLAAGCTTQQPFQVTPTPTATPMVTGPPAMKMYSQAEVDLRAGMRKIWTDHVVWERMYLIESLSDSPAAGDSAARLLQNPVDIGNAITAICGDAVGNQMKALFREHILIEMDLINAVKTGNATAQAAAERRWSQNADQTALFMSSVNPHCDRATAQDFLYRHMATTKDEIMARYTKNATADVQAWDAVHNHMLTMSDTLATGILRQHPEKFGGPEVYTQEQLDLENNMRKLWTDHTVWTRLYIIESLDDSPAAGAAATRLLQNQVDIGNAIKPVYGDAAGTQLTTLLREHILIAVDIIDAEKAKNTTAQVAAETEWTQNADEIAVFLAGANPNWSEPVLKDLMHMHLSTTKDELVARYTKNYAADVQAWDANYNNILTISDALSEGMVKQFPAMFGT
jgi:hypothetical protein